MKKSYQAPETTIIEVMTSQLICLSGTLDGTQEITNSGGFGSRGGSDWDDDEY